MSDRTITLIVLDSCGCGALPDAERFGDAGANTLAHIAQAVGGLNLPHLQKLGLGHATTILGVPPDDSPGAFHGRMLESSPAKDTTTGHWEIAGLINREPFQTFPEGFPPEIIKPLEERAGRRVLGNIPASGTEIIEKLGREHMADGSLIVYTSGDSVFQIAAHEKVIPLDELYRICEIAFDILKPWRVGRVIARPFIGEPGAFKRTYNRRDFSVEPPANTVLDHLVQANIPVVGIGKIHDIFAGRGVSENIHTDGNADGIARTIAAMKSRRGALIFTNLVDFDMLYGHRRDVKGYAQALKVFDDALPAMQDAMREGDILLLTADHGNDPTAGGSDHTREYVPVLAWRKGGVRSGSLGERSSFADIGATLAELFGVAAPPAGAGFAREILA
ncbi:MAG: Phosphopentomutase [Myxococcota bacterium]|nr:Phosphopentomutase [Myxococcota bacterium]